jgi:hypothetical protein
MRALFAYFLPHRHENNMQKNLAKIAEVKKYALSHKTLIGILVL